MKSYGIRDVSTDPLSWGLVSLDPLPREADALLGNIRILLNWWQLSAG